MFNHVTHAKYIILALEANVQSWIRHDFADINIYYYFMNYHSL